MKNAVLLVAFCHFNTYLPKSCIPLFLTSSIHYDFWLNRWHLNNLGPPLEFQRKKISAWISPSSINNNFSVSSLPFFIWMPLQRIFEDFHFLFFFMFHEDSAADTSELFSPSVINSSMRIVHLWKGKPASTEWCCGWVI